MQLEVTRHEVASVQAFGMLAVDGTNGFLKRYYSDLTENEEASMGFGRGVLLWLIGIPIPIIILIALLMHH